MKTNWIILLSVCTAAFVSLCNYGYSAATAGGGASVSLGSGAIGVGGGAVGVNGSVNANQGTVNNNTGAQAQQAQAAQNSQNANNQPNQNPANNNAATAQPGDAAGGNSTAQSTTTQSTATPTTATGQSQAVTPTQNANNTSSRDQAITATDKTMLVQMRAAAFPPGTAVATSSSVSFILKDGAVRLVGTVPSVAEQQRILAVAQQTPGITRVYISLTVSGTESVGASASAGGGVGTGSASGGASATAAAPAPTTQKQAQPLNSFVPTNIGGRVPDGRGGFTSIVY